MVGGSSFVLGTDVLTFELKEQHKTYFSLKIFIATKSNIDKTTQQHNNGKIG